MSNQSFNLRYASGYGSAASLLKNVHLWVPISAVSHHCQDYTLTCDLNLAGRPHKTYGRAPLPSTPIINQCSRFKIHIPNKG